MKNKLKEEYVVWGRRDTPYVFSICYFYLTLPVRARTMLLLTPETIINEMKKSLPAIDNLHDLGDVLAEKEEVLKQFKLKTYDFFRIRRYLALDFSCNVNHLFPFARNYTKNANRIDVRHA